MGEVNKRAVEARAARLMEAITLASLARVPSFDEELCSSCGGTGRVQSQDWSDDERGAIALGSGNWRCDDCDGCGRVVVVRATAHSPGSATAEAVRLCLLSGAFDERSARERMSQWVQVLAADWLGSDGSPEIDVPAAVDLAVTLAVQAGAREVPARNRLAPLATALGQAWGAAHRSGGSDACPF